MLLDDPELGHVPVGATADRRALKHAGKDAYVRSKDIDSATGFASTLEIHCCPPLYLQKHNLFGHGNLPSYAYTIADLITLKRGITVPPEDRLDWMEGNIKVTEVHLTANFGCPSDHVHQIIAALDENNSSGKSRPSDTWITLGLAPSRRSLYHALTIYAKYQELLTKFKNPEPWQAKLLEEAGDTIRAEIKLYSKELKYCTLGYTRDWCDKDVAEMFFEYFARYNVYHSIQRLLTDDELAVLSKAEIRAYKLWLTGEELTEHYGRTGLWKLAKSIRDKVNVDITGARRPEALPQIDLRSVFAPENVVGVPEWLRGSEHYWGPKVSPYSPNGIGRVRVITDEELLRMWEASLAKPADNAGIEEEDVPY